jgi:hypothetical protein
MRDNIKFNIKKFIGYYYYFANAHNINTDCYLTPSTKYTMVTEEYYLNCWIFSKLTQ